MSERRDNNKYQFKYNLANDYALGEEALITALAQKTRVFYLEVKIKTNEINLSFALEKLMNYGVLLPFDNRLKIPPTNYFAFSYIPCALTLVSLSQDLLI